MKLNEALKILKENDYLAEFLNTSVSLDQLVKLMVKNNIISDDVIIEHDCDAIGVQNLEEDLTRDDVYNFSKKCEKFIDRLAVFIRKYGWEFIHTSFSKADILNFNEETNKVEIVLYNRSRDTHDYGTEFYHSTTLTKEEIIDSNKGLRVKTRFSEITEPKIYLLSAKLINMKHPRVNSMYTGDTTLKKVLSYYADHDFGDNLYKITLPKNFIVKKDAEHSDMSQNSPEVYVTQNIPAKYITYVGSINDMLFNESLKLSKEHKYLTEFLQTTSPISSSVIIRNIAKEIEKVTGDRCTYTVNYHNDDYDEDFCYNLVCDGLFEDGELNEDLLLKILRPINTKFHYNCRIGSIFPEESRVIISVWNLSPNAKSHIYKFPIGNRIFVHNSEISPDIIMKSGLRCKATDYYGEPRLYFMSYENYDGSLIDIIKELKTPEADGFYPYGENKYLTVLPKHIKVRHDPENPDGDWCFIVENIPPENILYISDDISVEEVLEFIKKKYKQFNIKG